MAMCSGQQINDPSIRGAEELFFKSFTIVYNCELSIGVMAYLQIFTI